MDTEDLLRLLNANDVDYVIIGASAFPVHGYSRTTLDIDIFIRPERQNAERVLKALEQFGYDVTDLSVEDLLTRKVLMRQYVTETDVHPFVAGTTFEKVWANKIEDLYEDTPAAFAGLDDLIAMKEAAGRPQDGEDLRYLRELKRRRDQEERSPSSGPDGP